MGLKQLIIGAPIASSQAHHQRLNKPIALAVFSSDALSSVAYATEAILVVLVTAGARSLSLSIPISIGIALLLLIVGFSYRQTIHAYPNGGGAYIVAHENLGDTAGLVAAAALLIDYVLTVAVSVSAGVFAITSLAQTWGFTHVTDYRVTIALACIAFITLMNLRGVKESGAIFSVPTYVFILSIAAMIVIGLGRIVVTGATPIMPTPQAAAAEAGGMVTIGLFLMLQAFSAGCTALTGVEAISNGVPAFRQPESRNAATTLLWMVGILGTFFLGISLLAHFYGAVPRDDVSVVSQLAAQVVGTGPAFFVIQLATALILVLAANTAYADFPRLASLLARDRFLPRQFASRGDRLVFSNGIVVLGAFAALLVLMFNAREQAMLPLYAIGVFISFTLSQVGMVRHWLHNRSPGWRHSIGLNALGACLTCAVFCVIVITRFSHGAWVVLVLLPLLVVAFRAVQHHYRDVARQLSLDRLRTIEPVRRHTALVLISGVHRGVIPALAFAQSIAPDNTTALYVDLDEEQTERIRQKWCQWGNGVPLVVLQSPYRSLIRPLLHYVDQLESQYEDDVVSVVLPEFIPSRWWEHFLHNQTALMLRTILLFRRHVVVISVPYHLEK